MLLRSPTLTDCATDLEREALLSLHRNVPFRAEQNSPDRLRRLTEAVAARRPVPDEDRWAAFTLAVRRADSSRIRGAHRRAAELTIEALRYRPADIDPATLPYHRAFLLINTLMQLVTDLMAAGADGSTVVHYGTMAGDLARRLRAAQPDEPDFARALSTLTPDTTESLALLDELAAAEPFPWRREEAAYFRAALTPPPAGWQADYL